MMANQQPYLPEQSVLQALVRQRYHQHLTTEQAETVDKGVEAVAKMLAELRAIPLANHEEPFTSFIPYRREA
jgi:hypothetical protein